MTRDGQPCAAVERQLGGAATLEARSEADVSVYMTP